MGENPDQGALLHVNLAQAAHAGAEPVFAAFGKGPLYGTYELSINGRIAGPPMDLYGEDAGSTGELSLGTFELAESGNILTVSCLGFSDDSASSRQFARGFPRAAVLPS